MTLEEKAKDLLKQIEDCPNYSATQYLMANSTDLVEGLIKESDNFSNQAKECMSKRNLYKNYAEAITAKMNAKTKDLAKSGL